MLDHLSITVADFATSEPFYDAIMAALGVVKVGRSVSSEVPRQNQCCELKRARQN